MKFLKIFTFFLFLWRILFKRYKDLLCLSIALKLTTEDASSIPAWCKIFVYLFGKSLFSLKILFLLVLLVFMYDTLIWIIRCWCSTYLISKIFLSCFWTNVSSRQSFIQKKVFQRMATLHLLEQYAYFKMDTTVNKYNY